jgi:hypothetical protein
MKKLVTLLFAASLFAFVACEQKSETTAAEGTEQVVEEVDGPAEDLQVEELQEEVVEADESVEAAHDHGHAEEDHSEAESAE